MKKILNTNYSDLGFNVSMLLLRVSLGLLMIPHGYDKLVHFADYKKDFLNFLGLGGTVSLALVVFAEFFCSIFVVMGLFTRLALIPLVIELVVVVFKAHNGDVFGEGEHGSLFLAGMLVLLICGPGKASLDGILSK
jgi:putative oxidoreductase